MIGDVIEVEEETPEPEREEESQDRKSVKVQRCSRSRRERRSSCASSVRACATTMRDDAFANRTFVCAHCVG